MGKVDLRNCDKIGTFNENGISNVLPRSQIIIHVNVESYVMIPSKMAMCAWIVCARLYSNTSSSHRINNM